MLKVKNYDLTFLSIFFLGLLKYISANCFSYCHSRGELKSVHLCLAFLHTLASVGRVIDTLAILLVIIFPFFSQAGLKATGSKEMETVVNW